MRMKGKVRSAWCICLTIGITILFFPNNGFAEAKFNLTPMFSVYARSDSNFWKSEENERQVYTYTLQPGIGLGVETPKTKVDLTYFLEAFFYEDQDTVPAGERDADDDNYVGHLGILDASWAPAERLHLLLNDSFYLTRRPTASDRFSDSIDRVKYWVNRFTPGLFYEFKNRFSIGLRYRRTDLDSDDDRDDFTEHRGLFNLLYNPTRTITLDLDYQRWTLAHDEEELLGDEYTSDQIQLKLSKRYKYFSFMGGIGYHNRDFEDSDLDDQDTVAYLISVTGQNPPPPEEQHRFGRDFVRAKTHMYLAYERNFNNLGYFVDTFIADRFTASVGRVFLDKIRIVARGYYQTNDYDNFKGPTPSGTEENREDNIWDIGASIGYLINEKMEVLFTAGREERDSNLAGFDYENDYFELSFNFNYDVLARGDFSKEASYYR